MDFDAYARTGVDLANARLDDLDDLRTLLPDWAGDELTERDLSLFRRARKRLREVFITATPGATPRRSRS